VGILSEGDRQRWHDDGWLLFDGLVPAAEVEGAAGALAALRPPPTERPPTAGSFGGIAQFPFADLHLSLLAVHPAVVAVAEDLLGSTDLRLYHAEAWAKYAGAADYDQDLHRDFVNHTLTVPSDDPAFGQVLCYLYLAYVGPGDGPTCFVSRHRTAELPLLPVAVSRAARPDLYVEEVAATGPAGTVVAYRPDTFHRGSALTRRHASRFTILMSFRPAGAEWGHRYGWADRGYWPGWQPFIESASPRQLALIGFPSPGHPYWTPATLAGVALRYPRLDLTPWKL
jgi:hypothetical protein